MRVDELRQGLASARDSQLAADAVAGRQGTDRRVRRQRVQRAGLAVLVVVMLAGAGVFLASRGTDEQRVISGPGASPHYLPDPLPEGTPLLQEFSGESGGNAFRRGVETVVWTSDPSESPSPDSPVFTIEIATGAAPDPSMREPVSYSDGAFTMLRWNDQAGLVATLRASDLTVEELRDIRDSVRVGGDGAVSLAPPQGYREVARRGAVGGTDPLFLSVFGPFVDVTEPGAVATFGSVYGDRINHSFSVTNLPRSQLWFILASGYGRLEQAELRGRAGYRWVLTGSSQSASTNGEAGEVRSVDVATMFFWWEDDETLLATLAATEEETRALAESMREVSQDEWERFAASASSFMEAQSTSGSFSSQGSEIAPPPPTTVP